MFDHYLITRFNLRNIDWKVTKNNEALLDQQWMDERMILFENYCLASIVHQTNNNFRWLIFFDTTTSDFYKDKIKKLLQSFPHIIALYIDGMQFYKEHLQNYIKEHSNQKSFLITSMLDNDDCLHKNYIQEVQDQFDQQDFLAIDFINGYTLQIEPTLILGKKDHIFNPFISLIEKNENPKTVWFYSHKMWKKEPRIKTVYDKRVWLSIIHGKNKVNKFDGYGNIRWSEINSFFILSAKTNAFLLSNIHSYRLISFSNLKNKYWINYFGFKYKIMKRKLGLYK